MRSLFGFLGWIGSLALLIPAIILIAARWLPESVLPYSDFIPSEPLFTWALWGAALVAACASLFMFQYMKDENTGTLWTWIKYSIIFVITAVLGAILGYAATIKGGYILGNTILKTELADSSPVALVISEKTHNTESARGCEFLISTNVQDLEIPMYEKFFYPTTLCVTQELYDGMNVDENIILVGKAYEKIGFFIDGVLTESDIAKIQESTPPAEAVTPVVDEGAE